MPFGPGWSPSDMYLLLQVIYRVYDTFKNVPDEYQDLLEKFHDIEHELNVLEKRLAEVGKDRFGAFPGATDLRKDLVNANKHLKQFESLSRKGFVNQIVNTTKFTFDSRRTLRYSHRMDIHRARLHDFRQDIILQATLSQLKTIRGATDIQSLPPDAIEVMSNSTKSLDEAGVLSPDHVSVLTQARRSVNLAKRLNRAAPGRPVRQLESIPSESPSLENSKTKVIDDAIHDFVNQVVAQAEASKLYLQTTVPETHIREFAKIAEWLDKIQRVVGESPEIIPDGKKPETTTFDTPVLEKFQLSTDTASTEPELSTWWASLAFQNSDHMRSVAKKSEILVSDTASSTISDIDDDDEQSAATERTSLPEIDSPAREILGFRSTAFFCNPSTGSEGMKCDLEISRSEGSTCIWATARGKFIAVPRNNNTATFLTPQAHLNLPQASNAEGQGWKPMVLRHSVEPGLKCFPAVMHPTIELVDPNNPLAPYEINFYDAQFLDVEGRGGTAGRIKGYKYTFASSEDRDQMREVLFGKTLLATAGYEESSASSCRIQSVTLWKTSDSANAIFTVTLPSRTNKSMLPHFALELRVLGCENLKKAGRDGHELVLRIQSMTQNPFGDELSTRRESMVSTSTSTNTSNSHSGGSTLMSRMSTRSRSTRSSSVPIDSLRVKLSDATDSEKKDKKAFLAMLSKIFEAG